MAEKIKTKERTLSVLIAILMLLSTVFFAGITALADNNGNLLETPKLTSVGTVSSGIQIDWGKVAGAEKYRVFYKTPSSGWTWIADTASTTYYWSGAKGNTDYTFTVRCINSAGNAYTSGYDPIGKSLKYVSTPNITSLGNGPYGIQITWGAISGAEKYRVFYKTGSGGWTKIADTTATTYAWTSPVSNTNYTFTVRCINSEGTAYTSGFDTVGKSIKYIAAPKLTSVSTASAAIQIDWGKVAGAEKYRVFYKTPSSGWTWIADTTSTTYYWNGAKGNTNYTFTVRCINSAGTAYTSGYDSKGMSIKFLSTPKLTSVSAGNGGTVISWGKVSGAETYRVFRKTGSGSWVSIGNTADTSFTDSTAAKGTAYAYTVRCLSGDGKSYASGFDTAGMSFKAVETPKISSVSATATGINITWGKVSGAEQYRVFYKTASSDWIRITDTTSTSYTWTGAKSGTDYTFTVRCVNSAKTVYTSGYDSKGTSIKYVAAPKLTAVNAVATGVQIKWDKVAGAENYRVFYKTATGSWTKIADTTETGYIWKGAKLGTKYTFTVRCLSSDASNYVSWFDSAGLGITYVSTPKISSAASNASGVSINWGSVSGAENYGLFYKIGSGDWRWIANTTSTSYTWTGANPGTTYAFTVRCLSSDGKRYASYYDTVGYTMTFYGVTLNSKANAAAEKYSNCTRYVYGTSAMGYQLEAYIINGNGSNSKILFMDFAVHGYEDEYAKDGKVLVTLGNGLVEYYSSHPELLGNYRLVIVPCANPDGTMFGRNNYRKEVSGAFGRCTYKGIDINRDFIAGGFKAVESVALRNLMNKYKPNVYLNFHGWEDSVIGNPQLVSIFRSSVGLTTDKSNKYGSDNGYIIGYVNNYYNAKAALVEFKNSRSVNQTKVINAINSVISKNL